MADTLADRIRTARKESGMSREQAAVALGVSLRTFARWETGESQQLTATRLQQIAAVLGKPLAYFLSEVAA